MSFRSRILRTEIEALRIALGAQASERHKELKEIPLIGGDLAFPYLFLGKLEPLLNSDPITFIREVIKLLGECEQDIRYNDVSRLSMIVGDTRKSFKVTPSSRFNSEVEE